MDKVLLFARKDWRIIRGSYGWLFPAMVLMYGLIGCAGLISQGVSFLPSFWAYLGCYNIALIEERYQADRLNFVLPGQNWQVVAGRYLYALGGGLVLNLVGAAGSFVMGVLDGRPSRAGEFLLLGMASTVILCTLLLTVYYSMGTQRSRWLCTGIYMVGVLVGPQLQTRGIAIGHPGALPLPGGWPLLVLAGAAVTLGIGLTVSTRAFASRRSLEGA